MGQSRQVRVGRVYDPPEEADGSRVLVDRIWPRGLRKDAAALDEWCKDVAPSTELRTWYGHDPALFEEFERRYRAELRDASRATALRHLEELARQGPLTLLTATRDRDISAATVLRKVLTRT
ncbi:DUF488 domain-containing protein [Streptomyces hiroshimensis]|uniref:DUF488 family protein n=1 Tax=Streptomyces hiroshimensis TaxID=66424 RepID=A0ABQ2Z1G5_9ACTN|nr:DUF488 family protein [Streptomyces hiroshimensis]GGY01301.1 hypothetical protein GCM10010324_55180 [Streptomyces hiroshimensis]